MTSIFNDGRGFIPSTVFVPHLLNHQFDIQSHEVAIIEADNQQIATQNEMQSVNNKIDIDQAARLAFERFSKKKMKI